MATAPPWPHSLVKDPPTLQALQGLIVLWNADKAHREFVQMTAGGVTDFPHSGYQARLCPCGTAFVIARNVLETYCGECGKASL